MWPHIIGYGPNEVNMSTTQDTDSITAEPLGEIGKTLAAKTQCLMEFSVHCTYIWL